VEASALARWSRNLGQKEHEGVKSIFTKGIIEWPGSAVAVLTTVGRKKRRKWGGGYFPPAVAFISEGERGGLGRPLGSATDAGIEPDR
jgi:hypothetical protein